jgi:uridylate kinase
MLKYIPMILGVKRSGESLNAGGVPGEMWTARGRNQTVAELGALAAWIKDPNKEVSGAIVVVGAGNGGLRGDKMKESGMDPLVADQNGLTGTIMNARVVASDLAKKNIPHRLLLAEGIDYRMPGMAPIPASTPEALQACIEEQLLAIVGGGSAQYNQSTDAAILDHLAAYRAATGAQVRALKGTKVDGVYDSDPLKNADARMLTRVSADVMRKNGWTAVDSVCLDRIEQTGIEMRVHNMDARLMDAVGGHVGTLIMPESSVMVYSYN